MFDCLRLFEDNQYLCCLNANRRQLTGLGEIDCPGDAIGILMVGKIELNFNCNHL